MTSLSLGRPTLLLLLGRFAGYGLALCNSILVARALCAERLGEYAYAIGLAGRCSPCCFAMTRGSAA